MINRWVVAIGGLFSALMIIIIPSASAQTSPTPYKNTVGVMIDSINGDTSTDINCFTEGSAGRFSTVNGDATLIMANRVPHTMVCVINIKKN
jgi:hypothetical protein